MKKINVSLILTLLVTSLVSCSENDNEPSGPNPADSVDIPLSDEDAAFLATLPDTIIQLQDIFFDDGQNVKDFLEANDPEFLETYSSGRIRQTKANSPHQQKLLFLSRMIAMGNYLVDDGNHTYASEGSDSPAQTGLAYSWGSKDYDKRQIPPTVSGCMDKKIYGLDCSGMVWAMTQAAGITVEPKYNFFVQYISSASKWTKAFKASADYKDLKMKDMGQIPRYKMKNGDVVLWGRHVGVFLHGKFYQSNGTSKAPDCSNNLQPHRGPRVISIDQVLAWGLGKYKVLRIELEFNYKLTIELIENDPCAYITQRSEDKVEMDIKVKDDEVIFSNIMNYNQTIHPRTITIVNDCSLTCTPAGAGHFNVASGRGEVQHDDKQERFTVELINTGSTTPSILLECPEWDPIETGSQTYEFTDNYRFVLEDSLQTQNSPGQYGLFVRLEPK